RAATASRVTAVRFIMTSSCARSFALPGDTRPAPAAVPLSIMEFTPHCAEVPPSSGYNSLQTKAGPLVRARLVTLDAYALLPMRPSPTTLVVAIVGVGNAVMVLVAPGTTLIVAVALALIAIGNAIAVAIPTGRHDRHISAGAA